MSYGIESDLLARIIQDVQAKSLLYIGDVPESGYGLVEFVETLSVSHVSNLAKAREIVSQPLEDKSLIVMSLSISKPEVMIASMLYSSAQHNIIHSTWIFFYPGEINQTQIIQSAAINKGLSPEAKIFLIQENGDCSNDGGDCSSSLVVQIIGNGYEMPILKVFNN